MLPSKKNVSPPAGQERKQSPDVTAESKWSPAEMGDKGSAGKTVPLALNSFLGVVQNVATDGLKVMTTVVSVLTDRGLPDLSSQLHKCFTDVTHMVELEELRILLETLHKVPLDEKRLLCLLSVFVHCQVDVLEKAAQRLKQLLHIKVKGKRLEEYLPQLDSQGTTSVVSKLAGELQTSQGHSPEVKPEGQGSKEREEVKEKLCPMTQQGSISTESSEGDKLHLVSEQEMKDVIDLLSGRQPALVAPPLPIPFLVQSAAIPSCNTTTSHAFNPAVPYGNHTTTPSHHHPQQLVFNPGVENIPGDNSYPVPLHHHLSLPAGAHKLPPPPVPQKPAPHLLHPHNLVLLENTTHHCALRPQASLDSALSSRTVKTNTWPLRPDRQQQTTATVVPAPAMAPNFPYDGFSSDLEFSQFVKSVRQRAGAGMGCRTRGRENPWGVVGDSSWSPLMYDSREGRQWSTAEDSSNCSDESSSNGDWMIGPELMSQSSRLNSSTMAGVQMGEVTGQNSLTQDVHSLPVTGEGSTTNTWPPKQPWTGGAIPVVPPTTHQVAPPPSHPPLGLTYSEPELGTQLLQTGWDMAGY